jgi:hypothetical protein
LCKSPSNIPQVTLKFDEKTNNNNNNTSITVTGDKYDSKKYGSKYGNKIIPMRVTICEFLPNTSTLSDVEIFRQSAVLLSKLNRGGQVFYHNDLRLDNVLYRHDNKVVFIDLENSKLVVENGTTYRGTEDLEVANEVLRNNVA